jgi:hypothetical protein
VIAVGKVMAMDSEDARFPGECVISLTCSATQAQAWAQFFGDTVHAVRLAQPVPTPPTEQASVPKEKP